MVYTLDLRGEVYTFNKDDSDKDKYIVFACAKDENDYIQEWVDYHLGIGFDKIIICDNNESGDESLSVLLETYINDGTVELFDVRGLKKFQTEVYDMFSSSNNYRWCAFIDIDEFIEIGSHYFDIKEFLESVTENCVLLNWMVYGYDNHLFKCDGDIQDNFRIPIRHIGMFKENAHIKSIVRGGSTPRFITTMHKPDEFSSESTYSMGGFFCVDNASRYNFPPNYKKAYIRHYYSRSIEDFFKKIKRGDASMDKIDETMSNGYNLMLLGNNSYMPIEKQSLGLYFYDNNENSVIDEEVLAFYDVICYRYSGMNPYGYIYVIVRAMMSVKNHTFILSGNIDDSLYNQLLDYSFETDNKVVYCEDDANIIYKTFLKYTKFGTETYYVYEI